MSRTLRRLVAGTVLAGSLATFAPAVTAMPVCYWVTLPNGQRVLVCAGSVPPGV